MKTGWLVLIFVNFAIGLSGCGDLANRQHHPVDLEATGIIGGQEAADNYIGSKYAMLIFDKPTNSYCTGLLIHRDVILTAAHCIKSDAAGLILAFGVQPLSGNYVSRRALKVVTHPHYEKNKNQVNNPERMDLALILLKDPAPKSHLVLEIPPPELSLAPGSLFTALGYGQIGNEQGAGVLRYVNLSIARISSSRSQFEVSQISGKGVCSGDSGGPAILRSRGKDYVIGVASAIQWQQDPCREKSVFMNTQAHREWILTEAQRLAASKASLK